MTHLPLVSVIVAVSPKYGPSETYLHFALTSIQRQTYPNIEILCQTEPGLSHARNEGIKRARGKYIAIQDCDDMSYPTRISKEVAILENNPGIVQVGSWVFFNRRLRKVPVWVTWPMQLFAHQVMNSSTMFRRDIAIKAGLYREKEAISEDYELTNRMLKFGKVHNIQEPLAVIRIGHHSHTRQVKSTLLQRELYARATLLRSHL